jgi:hypothetical protein
MIEQKRKEINGTTYLVNQMGGTRALKVQTKLVGLLGRGILEVLEKGGANNPKEIITALLPVLDNFDDEKAFSFVEFMFSGGGLFIEKRDGDIKVPVSLDFEKDFIGKPFEMWKVLGFILEANFAAGK